jgi:predicted DNA-binding protein (MmcQ/YjbR family)
MSVSSPRSGPADDDDPRLQAIRQHCFAQDSERVTEEYPWGHPVWKTAGKMFAACGNDGAGLTVKATLDQQAALVQHPAIRVADYVGRYGWVTIEITDSDTLEMGLDLIDQSFDLTAPKKRAAKARI